MRAIREAQVVTRPLPPEGDQAVQVVHDPVVMPDALERGAAADLMNIAVRVSGRLFRPPVRLGRILLQKMMDNLQVLISAGVNILFPFLFFIGFRISNSFSQNLTVEIGTSSIPAVSPME